MFVKIGAGSSYLAPLKIYYMKRKTRKDCTVDMSDCPYPSNTKEYKNYRQKLYRRAKGITAKKKPAPRKRAKKKVSKVRADLCVCCKSVELERDPLNNSVMNGSVFMRTDEKGRIIKAFACDRCV